MMSFVVFDMLDECLINIAKKCDDCQNFENVTQPWDKMGKLKLFRLTHFSNCVSRVGLYCENQECYKEHCVISHVCIQCANIFFPLGASRVVAFFCKKYVNYKCTNGKKDNDNIDVCCGWFAIGQKVCFGMCM